MKATYGGLVKTKGEKRKERTARLTTIKQCHVGDQGGRRDVIVIRQPQGHGSRKASARDGHSEGAVAVDLDRDAASSDIDIDDIVLGDHQARHSQELIGSSTAVEREEQLRIISVQQPNGKSTVAYDATISDHVCDTQHVGLGSAGHSRLNGHGEFIVWRQGDDTLVVVASGIEIVVCKDHGTSIGPDA
jgi:hypothetical protein